MDEKQSELKLFSEQSLQPFLNQMQTLIYKISMKHDLQADDIKRLMILKSVISTYTNLVLSDKDPTQKIRSKSPEATVEKSSELDTLTQEFDLDKLDQSFRQHTEIITMDKDKDSNPDPIQDMDVNIDYAKLKDDKETQIEMSSAIFQMLKEHDWYRPIFDTNSSEDNINSIAKDDATPSAPPKSEIQIKDDVNIEDNENISLPIEPYSRIPIKA